MSATTGISLQEFYKLAGRTDERLELADGEIVSMPPPTYKHKLTQRRLRKVLDAIAQSAGFGFCEIELSYRVARRQKTRIADVAVVSWTRHAQADLEGGLEDAPEIVVEVVSGEPAQELVARRSDAFVSGAVHFWTVNLPANAAPFLEIWTGADHCSGRFGPQDTIVVLGTSLALDAVFTGFLAAGEI